MNVAQLCPVCKGAGSFAILADPQSTCVYPSSKPCHGCGGQGWITIQQPDSQSGVVRYIPQEEAK
jgi:DnaJ-class molecular chaperone